VTTFCHLITRITASAEAFKAELDTHPECRGDLAAAHALAGTPRRHAAFFLGRFPDLDQGEGKPASPPPRRSPEERLLHWLEGATAPLDLLNPIQAVRSLGKGTGTIPASFGIPLNPEADFAPRGPRPLAEVLREGLPDPETSGIFPEMREDIEATKALAPSWLKIALPDMQGPFNIAQMVLGDDAFLAPLTDPDEWDRFMELITEFFNTAHRTLVSWIGPERLYTHPTRLHRLTECSVNMASTDFYLEHIARFDRRIAAYYGEVALHPCSGPHVFYVTLENVPNVVYTEAGRMINKMAAGSISVDEALAAIGDRPVMLGIGEELPAGGEQATMQRLFDLAVDNPRLTFGFTGLGWKKADEPTMRDLHRRMDDYYASVVEAGPKHGT
jgi:hypothetical protein